MTRFDAVLSVADCVGALTAGQVTAVQLAQAAIDRIEKTNPKINAVTRILRDRAMQEAAAVDAQLAAGIDPGPLAGVPYGVKDLFDVAGEATTAGAGRLRHAKEQATTRKQSDGSRLLARSLLPL
jgi:aspartyl-tRNA(Asn)/glutamyl-tRNA(Gln) amidotransferase subunit A